MADQLLSQADVDALIQSLSRTEAAKPVPAAAKPANTPPNKNVAAGNQSAASRTVGPMPLAPAQKASLAAQAPKPAPAAIQASKTTLAAAQTPKVSSLEKESKADTNQAAINSLNAKASELEQQLNQLAASVKRLDFLEKKITELESQIELNRQDPGLPQKIEVLSGQLRKIAANLKGTPGYDVRDTFKCEKCRDEGHVAVMFRCTGCGHERWYGWWPDK
jgi:hypothetical protein